MWRHDMGPDKLIPLVIMVVGFGGCLTVLYFGMFVWVPK
jgi:hypothetical protein